MKLVKTHRRNNTPIPVIDSAYLIVRRDYPEEGGWGIKVEISPFHDSRLAGAQEHVLHLSLSEAWDLVEGLHAHMRTITALKAPRQ